MPSATSPSTYTDFVSWISLVSLVGATQGCFIAYLLLGHGRRRRANLWLGLYVAGYAAICLGDALSNSSLVLRFPDVAELFDFSVLLLGPFLYQYVRILTGRKSLGGILWVHLIPAGLAFLLMLSFHLAPMEMKRAAVAADAAASNQVDPIVAIWALQVLAYLIAGLLLLHRHGERLKQSYSSVEKLSFTWLRNLLLVNCVLWLIWMTAVVTGSRITRLVDAIAFPIAAYVLAAFALRTPEVLVAPEESPSVLEPSAPESAEEIPEFTVRDDTGQDDAEIAAAERYGKARLPEAILQRYQTRLTELTRDEKPYLENDLTLPGLAKRLRIPSHHLSQLLNVHLGVNFFDYVNRLRVSEIQRLLRDPANADCSILELALKAGFSSKSSFNAIFKRTTGHSPSAYRKLNPVSEIAPKSRTSSPVGPDDTFGASL